MTYQTATSMNTNISVWIRNKKEHLNHYLGIFILYNDCHPVQWLPSCKFYDYNEYVWYDGNLG
jgi:hypothetical protein